MRAVVSVSRSFIENLVTAASIGRSSRLSRTAVDMGFWQRLARARRESLGLDDRTIVVSYIGTVGMAHDVGTSLRLRPSTRRRGEDVRFLVVGRRRRAQRSAIAPVRKGLDHVTFTGLVPRERIPDYLAASDISLVTLKRSDVFKAVLRRRCRVDGGGTASCSRFEGEPVRRSNAPEADRDRAG